MVRKKLAVVIAALGAFQTGMVSALGMGDFSLNSALNQPLDAEIKLLNTRDLDTEQVRISLAKPSDFNLSGIDRDFFLTNIEFVVELDGEGNGVVKLTTREPVVEPFLNFLLETRWPTGRLLREYTVLLDLPVFSQSASEGIDGAVARQGQRDSGAPAPVETSASVSTMSSAYQASTDNELRPGESYRVQSDDTLWKIAAKSRPSKNVSIQQAIVSIQRLNPGAFMGGNINRLKAGSVLRLPVEDEIDVISGKSAVREVANQNRAWRAGEDSESMDDVQLDATDQEEYSEAAYEDQGRLSIATRGDADDDGGVEGDGGEKGSVALRNELNISEETLSKVERENGELKSRLDGMEDKIVTLQRLLELKDDQLTAMQSELSDDDIEGESVTARGEDSEPQLDPGSETPPVAVPEVKPETKPEVKAIPKTIMKKPEPSFFEKYIGNPLYSGGAALLVLIIAALVIIRRRKNDDEEILVPVEEYDEEEDENTLADLSLDPESSPEDIAVPENEVVAEPEEDITDQLVAELEESIAAESAEEIAAKGLEPASESAGVQSEIGDVIAEVDIYIAYGRFQQAAELLTTAISQEPGRSDLQVKLLQVYLETRDKPAFQRQYLSLYALGEENAVVEVKEMLSTVDGASDWLDDLPGESVSLSQDDLSPESDLADADLDLDEELEIDLELDEDLDSTVLMNSNNAGGDTESSDADEFDLELDLDESLSSNDTVLLNAVKLDEQSDDGFGDLAMEASLVDEGLDIDLEVESDSDLDDLSLDIDSSDDDSSDDLDFDSILGGDDLGDLDLDDQEDSEALDLNLDSAATSDLDDLDLGDLDTAADSDLDDLDLGDLDTAADSDLDDLDLGDLEGAAESDLDDLDLGDLDAAADSDLGDLDLGDLDAAADSDLDDLDLGDLDAAADSDLDDLDLGDLDAAADSDLGDLDLGGLGETEFAENKESDGLDLDDLDLDSPSGADELSDKTSTVDDGFDLDLESDNDLDMDLGELGEGDLGDLAAEFDDVDSAPKSVSEQTDADRELEEDFNFESLESVDQDLGGESDVSESLKEGLEIEDLHFEPALSSAVADSENLTAGIDEDQGLVDEQKPSNVDDSKEDVALGEMAGDESFDTPEGDLDDEDDFDFLSEADEVATKLDLARAYIDMGDTEGARDILDEVVQEGNAEQKMEADSLIERID